MSDVCVVVADAAKARLFTLEAAIAPKMESGPNLVERSSMTNAMETTPGRDKYSDVKSGRTTSGAGAAHGLDDHRDKHDAEYTRRFAQKIASEAFKLAGENKSRQLIVAADKRMLGVLRQEMGAPSKGLEIRELAKDLTNFSLQDIQSHLANENLVPAQRKP